MFVNGANALPNASDLRVCPDAMDISPARPTDNRVPRASYPGIVVGGFAELLPTGVWGSAFAIDAYSAALFEVNGSVPCSTLSKATTIQLPMITNPTPRAPHAHVLVGGGNEPLAIRTLKAAATATLPSVQLAVPAPWFHANYEAIIYASFGPLTMGCKGTPFTTGAIDPTSVTSVTDFTRPPDYEANGLILCAKKKNGIDVEVVLAQSFADIQARSMPASTPKPFFGLPALYLIVVVGEKNAMDAPHELHAVMIPYLAT